MTGVRAARREAGQGTAEYLMLLAVLLPVLALAVTTLGAALVRVVVALVEHLAVFVSTP